MPLDGTVDFTAMAEWLIVLLLVPAMVVPAVLLLGFAGCRFDHGVASHPTLISADGKDVKTITLTWSGGSFTQVRFERYRGPEYSLQDGIFDTSSSPFDDNNGLHPNTPYRYFVYGVAGDGSITGGTSADGSTLAFEPTFDETAAFIADAAALGAVYTLVQRIEPDALKPISHTPVQVRITLYAPSVGPAVIYDIFVSAPSSAPGAKPYDSAADLTPVPLPTIPLVVPANTQLTLPVPLDGFDLGVDYVVVPKVRPLLIAVNLSASSRVRQTGPVPANIAVAYQRLGPEAALQTRSPGYTALPRVLLIGKIEIG